MAAPTWGGMTTLRLPASVLGGPTTRAPDGSVMVRSIETVACSRSTSPRWRPRTSPRRSWHQAASRIATRYLSGVAFTAAPISATVAVGRDAAFSVAAPLTRHGVRPITPSSAALAQMVERSRYAPAAVDGWRCSRSACQLRTCEGVSLASGVRPSLGRMCRRSSPSYLALVVGRRSRRCSSHWSAQVARVTRPAAGSTQRPSAIAPVESRSMPPHPSSSRRSGSVPDRRGPGTSPGNRGHAS